MHSYASTYIRIAQLASRPGRPGKIPVSASTIWRWVKAGVFPRPVKISSGTTAWKVEDVEAFLDSQAAASA